ncbi:uncharacterized protein BO97DRAFT_425112 [Aspergillus homomorphus CBS 101889]|uniref:Tat pathway signal sequence n=1 Tax=Aspergillus homomorphus (strain CBS 101889) TaxID=1450537 RepID=A0A395HV47_ASPHC|nr:hypothetical protein BO97DRAFT_425112 [Aspergillus homomorphus CBS 101889]RAL11812.1 hypothetical protein BO97DRAFT_425112 [Aspergillus homomorphus CBS 101889]
MQNEEEHGLLSTVEECDLKQAHAAKAGGGLCSSLIVGISAKSRAVTALALVSIALNIFLAAGLVRSRDPFGHDGAVSTPYAELQWEKPDTLWWKTAFSDGDSNESSVDELWDNDIPWERGIIALRKDEARRMGLPESQPFPWDVEKSIYILNAHHILHCVEDNLSTCYALQRNLFISLQEFRDGRPQSIDYPHLLHCLDSIRLETMCTADDTPRYVPLNDVHGFRPGDGQQRMCRDWNKLEEFVQDHDPCYRYVYPGDSHVSNLERFKFCPNDSPYLPRIREHFGYPDAWMPWPVVE